MWAVIGAPGSGFFCGCSAMPYVHVSVTVSASSAGPQEVAAGLWQAMAPGNDATSADVDVAVAPAEQAWTVRTTSAACRQSVLAGVGTTCN